MWGSERIVLRMLTLRKVSDKLYAPAALLPGKEPVKVQLSLCLN